MLKKSITVFVACVSLLLIGCKSAEHTDIGSIRESGAFIIGELEASVDAFDRGVEGAIERSKSITDEVDRLGYLFGEYEQAALQLREELRTAKAKLEALQNIYDSSDCSGTVDDSSPSCNDNTKS